MLSFHFPLTERYWKQTMCFYAYCWTRLMRRDNILDKLGWLESLGKLGSIESFFKPETEACNAEWAAAQGWVKYSTIRALEKKKHSKYWCILVYLGHKKGFSFCILSIGQTCFSWVAHNSTWSCKLLLYAQGTVRPQEMTQMCFTFSSLF